jgi:hypothetical protein
VIEKSIILRFPRYRFSSVGKARANAASGAPQARQAIPMIVIAPLIVSRTPERCHFSQVNFAASGIGPSKVGSRRRNSITSVSASATRSLRAASDVSVPSRKSAPVM